MSDQELLSHYYRYKLNQFGNFACPLYQDGLPENQQECTFDIEIQGEQISGNQFEQFWNHVRSVHQVKYNEIISICRAQVPIDSTTTTKVDQMTDLITSASGKLHKLVTAFALDSMNGNMNGNTFLKEFKATLSALENQITILAQPANPTTTAEPSSLSKFM